MGVSVGVGASVGDDHDGLGLGVGVCGFGLAVGCGVAVGRSVGPGVRALTGGTVALGVPTTVSPGDATVERDGRDRTVEVAAGVACGSPLLPSTAWVGAVDPTVP